MGYIFVVKEFLLFGVDVDVIREVKVNFYLFILLFVLNEIRLDCVGFFLFKVLNLNVI